MRIKNIRKFSMPGWWTVHSYYTLNPYAPDGSGRILCAGCDPDTGMGEVFILDCDGYVLERFGRQRASRIFYLSGFWQAWNGSADTVYFQSSNGDMRNPRVTARELSTGREYTVRADMEGAPIFGEPILYGLTGMYYAAGYADGRYHPEWSPVPFERRREHGLFRCSPHTGQTELAISVEQALEMHPLRARLLAEDDRVRKRTEAGLTLMIYCARFSRDGKYVMFHFGNHCTDRRRGEGHILSLFTARCDAFGRLSEIQMALDLSFERDGVHWSWTPENTLLGYMRASPDDPLALTRINRDGGGRRLISRNALVGGHASLSPRGGVYVTDGASGDGGKVLFLDGAGEEIKCLELPKRFDDGTPIPPGRNARFICHHPVFNADGSRVLLNIMDGRFSQLCELELEY